MEDLESIAKDAVIQYGKQATERDIYWMMRERGYNEPDCFIGDILSLIANAVIRVKF